MKWILFGSIVFAFLGTVLITLLGIAGVIPVAQRYLDKLFIAIVVEAAAAFFTLFRNTDFLGPQAEAAVAGPKISGDWWEMIHNHPNIAVNWIQINYSASSGRLEITGEAYAHEGGHVAHWTSHAACIQVNGSRIEVGYFWAGKELTQIDDRFTGVGWLEFEDTSRKLVTSGSGWFTSGDIEGGKLTARCVVDLLRLPAPKDEPSMGDLKNKEDRAKRAAAAYAQWHHGLPKPAARNDILIGPTS